MIMRLQNTIAVPPGAANTGKPSRSPIVGGGRDEKYRFTVLADGLLRYEWAPDCQFEDRPSVFAMQRDKCDTPEYRVEETADTLEIITSRFHLTYDKQEFTPHGLFAVVKYHMKKTWRYGEEPSPGENMGGTNRTLDDADGWVDMGTGVVSKRGHASIDDSHTMLFDEGGFPAARRPGNDRVDGYLFAYGHDYREAVKALYMISGPTPLLPRWALGNWWSRYYPYTADSYIALMDKFRDEQIPLSVGVLDIDWHLIDDPRAKESGTSGWTGYTWNRDLFPDPPALLEELHKRGLKTTLNDHPAEGIFSFEDLYEDFAKAVGRDPTTKEPIPFDITDRKYLKAYFDVLMRSLEKDGMDFVWIDWQQGPYSRLKGVDPLWVLNHFHYLHNARYAQNHPSTGLILSRYAGPGSHRYPVGFSGDARVTWASLAFQPEFTATASNVGYGWWSHDIGGHIHGVKDVELTTRWVQLGAFSPILRLHSSNTPWVTKEPWRLPAGEPRDAVVGFLRLRHRLLPYLHAMNARAAEKGEPLVQPMYWEYPEEEVAYRYRNEYLFGSEMVVVPITAPQDRAVGLGRTRGWLPPGRYVDFFMGVVYEGSRELWFSRPLDSMPVLLRQGAIVPLDRAEAPGNGCKIPESIEVVIVVGADGIFDMVEHDEEAGARLSTVIEFEQDTGKVSIHPTRDKSGAAIASSSQRHWSLRLMAFARNDAEVQVQVGDGQASSAQVSRVPDGYTIDLGSKLPGERAVASLGSDPKLITNDIASLIHDIVDRAQIEYDMKDVIGKLFDDSKTPRATQILGLEALGLSDELRVAITEALLADVQI